MSRTLVAGVDSSTQSTKVIVCDADTGEVVREGRAPHPEGTEVDPRAWWRAFTDATTGGLLDGVRAIAVGAQQHGLITLDGDGQVVRPALLWNDTRSAGAARDLVSELGGPGAWAEAVGSVPLASFTVAKVRWVAEHEPELAARIEHLALPHDWLTARLRSVDGDESGRVTAPLVTDRGDASGTGYWSPAENRYRDDLVVRALGRQARTPEVLGPHEAAGETPDGMLVGPGTGDNMGAALGLGAGSGDVIVSLGTSGTVFAVHDAPTADATGAVAGFADATGRYLPLVCTLNAARVLTSAAAMLGTDLAGLERLAGEAEPGADGLVLLPYLDGERTPDLPHATGTLSGLTRANMTPANLARAAVEGMLCGLADGLDALRDQGVRLRRVVLIGGAARSAIVQHVGAIVLGLPVVVPAPAEYVALGAARQAAWVVRSAAGSIEDSSQAPQWTTASLVELPVGNADDRARVRAVYAAVRDQVHGAALRR